MYGPSTSNQRIESWWSILRKNRFDWWVNYFKDLRDRNVFDGSIPYHLESVRLFFLDLIQRELNDVKVLWNNHHIRKVRIGECPSGHPNVIFFAPELNNGRDVGKRLSRNYASIARFFCKEPKLHGCSKEFTELSQILMREHGMSLPSNVEESEHLLVFLINQIDSL